MRESQDHEAPNIVQVPNQTISGGPGWCSPWCWLNTHKHCRGKAEGCYCLCHDPKWADRIITDA